MGSILSNCDFQLPQTGYANPNSLRIIQRYYTDNQIKELGNVPDQDIFKKSPGYSRRRFSTLDESDTDHQWLSAEKE